MRRNGFWGLLVTVVLLIACGRPSADQDKDEQPFVTRSYEAVGDSMLYGLACDGCTDTVLVLLPDSGGDPVNYNILQAMREHKVFGRPTIGDKMAVLVNPDNPTELLLAIDLEQVKGTWYYVEMPQLRHHRDSSAAPLVQLSKEDQLRMDSMLRELMVPREYSYSLKRDFTVSSAGGHPRSSSLDRESPVVYPPMKRYTEWHVFNGKIIFTYGGYFNPSNNDSVALVNDTAEFVLLRRDSMALRFADRIQGFTLKRDTVMEDTGASGKK